MIKNLSIKKDKDKNESEGFEKYHIKELDGIRALAIIIIVWYHFWQQSWIVPVMGPINLDWLIRNGSILVDMLVLLSAFCLFLPYARQMVFKEQAPAAKYFYINRIARIAPSYYICIFIVLMLFAIPLHEYQSKNFMIRDIFSHMFFIHNWFSDTLLLTKLNGVLWTVALEVQYYLIFPLIAKAFVRRPKTTYFSMIALGLLSCFLISNNFSNINQALFVNNAFTFAGVFANGMLGAWIYCLIINNRKRSKAGSIIFTLLAIGSIYAFRLLCMNRQVYGFETKWQIDYRFLLSIVFLIFMISSIMSAKIFRKILNNGFMRFIAKISFNLYIWHQFISVRLKEFHIPMWYGDTPPNILGDKVWQWKYMILCIFLSLLVASFMTYCVEIPIAKIIKNRFNKNQTQKLVQE